MKSCCEQQSSSQQEPIRCVNAFIAEKPKKEEEIENFYVVTLLHMSRVGIFFAIVVVVVILFFTSSCSQHCFISRDNKSDTDPSLNIAFSATWSESCSWRKSAHTDCTASNCICVPFSDVCSMVNCSVYAQKIFGIDISCCWFFEFALSVSVSVSLLCWLSYLLTLFSVF